MPAGPGVNLRVTLAEELQSSTTIPAGIRRGATWTAKTAPGGGSADAGRSAHRSGARRQPRHAPAGQHLGGRGGAHRGSRGPPPGCQPVPGDMFGGRDGVAVGETDGEPVEVVVDRVVE
ncbi:hypothetical protein DSL92_08535 [Billgrantia gudaonensis]|uniref:Uncharacterized protein n=1 Tax=Billgrantia gudaonensis TaxID=376427 RepID=A0A3S0NDH7_9GAMM|nr:hypothetical protein DSL92_08535 [Halomonas gudaonensis]